MPISEHETRFLGQRIVTWEPAAGSAGRKPRPAKAPAGGGVYRIAVDPYGGDEGPWVGKFEKFLATPLAAKAVGLVVGVWGESTDDGASAAAVVKALAAAKKRLPKLRGLFLGDITYEEMEISWIHQTDVAPLLRAYPALEHLRVRGGAGLSLGPLRHEKLKALVVEAGGLPASVVRQVGASKLPALQHLELWLGTEEYGGDSTPKDVEKILSGKLFPKLRHLGLRDCAWADALARAVAASPLLQRVRTLDLSLGNLSDEGGAALLSSASAEALAKMEKVDLHHHYLSPWMVKLLKTAIPRADLGDAKTPDVYDGKIYRYVSVAE